MKDKISIPRLALLHPAVKDTFQKFIEDSENSLNVTLRIVQGLRTFAEQDAIYQQGRTTPGKIVSNSKAGQSYHNYGLAIDLGELENGNINWEFDYSKLLPFMPIEMSWGGNFHSIKDKPHFEITFGHPWQGLLSMYNNKQFIPDSQYLKLA